MTPPMDKAAVDQAIRDAFDHREDLLEIVQGQIDRDRNFYRHLYTVTAGFIAILVGVGGFFFYGSISQMRADAKQSVDNTLSLVQSQSNAAAENAKATVQRELADVRTEVQKRIDTEFKNENITQLVESVANKRTESELAGDIRKEAAAQVQAGIKAQGSDIRHQVESQTKEEVQQLRPEISTIINDQLAKQVKDSVAPVEAKMKVLGMSILAESGDRHAFDQLASLADRPDVPDEQRTLAKTAVADVVRKYTNALRRMQITLRVPLSNEQLLNMLKTSPFPLDRAGALDHISQTPNDVAILPTIVDTIKNDGDLEVVTTAFMVFDNITKQQFVFPNWSGLENWWAENRAGLLK